MAFLDLIYFSELILVMIGLAFIIDNLFGSTFKPFVEDIQIHLLSFQIFPEGNNLYLLFAKLFSFLMYLFI